MQVLVTEPNLARAKAVGASLQSEGVDVILASTGEEAVQLLSDHAANLVVLSPVHPDITDGELVGRLRFDQVDVPMLAAYVEQEASTSVTPSMATSDGAIIAPSGGLEVLARIRRAAWARHGFAPVGLQFRNISLCVDRREAVADGVPVPLTSKEFAILELLLLRRNTILSKDAFLAHLYADTSKQPPAKIIDVFVFTLRRKLAQAGAPGVIGTVWGRGYVVRDDSRDRTTTFPWPDAPSEVCRNPLSLVPA